MNMQMMNLEPFNNFCNSPRHPERSEGSLANGMDCVQPFVRDFAIRQEVLRSKRRAQDDVPGKLLLIFK
jgi:hypothetical protein